MAFGNLADVTRALITLLEANVNVHLQGTLGPDVTALPVRPDRIDPGVQNQMSLHLYHIAEDPYYKNAAGPGNDAPNVAKAPMSLCLFYILTPHHNDGQTGPDAYREHEMMGMALKTFHDHPVITDRTAILQPDGVTNIPILPLNLRNRQNSIQVILRPVTPEDAIGFWASEDQQIPTLSAYYEARVIFLEPERPQSVPGIVLNLGVYLQQLATPDLRTSTSAVRFTLPATAGGGQPPAVESSPARAVLDDRVAPPPEHRRFRLVGSNLAIGRSRTLVLRNSRWQIQPAPIDEAPVDLALNPNWSVRFSAEAVDVEFRSTLDVQTPGGIQTLNVLPGIYSAQVRVVTNENVVFGQLKQLASSSNETAFAIVPRIVSQAVAAGLIQVNLGPEFDLSTLTLTSDQIRVSLGGVAYSRTTVDPPSAAATFRVSGPNQITLRSHTGLDLTPATPAAHSFRIIVNGAESPPFWIELP